MAWLSALSRVAVGAQDQGRSARLQTPLSKSALIDLLARTFCSCPAVLAQISLLSLAKQGVSNARWQFFPTPSISVRGAQRTLSPSTRHVCPQRTYTP